MEVRDDDDVDRLRIDPGGGEIRGHGAGGRGDLAGAAGVEQNQLRPGVDQQRRERDRQLVRREKRIRQCFLHCFERRIADEALVDRPMPNAVVEGGHLEIADLVAIDAGGLLAGGRGIGAGGLERGSERGERGGGEQRTAGDFHHSDGSPLR
jgi:hypothetical protein